MKRLYFISFVTALAMTFISCDLGDDGENFHYEALEVTNVELPESFHLYDVYDIKVTMRRPDDCTIFDGFNVSKEALTTRNVAPIGIVFERNNCSVLDQEIEDSFKFEVIYDEPYLFRFYNGNDANGDAQFIEVEVPVN